MAQTKAKFAALAFTADRSRATELQEKLDSKLNKAITDLKAYEEDLGLEDEMDLSDEELEERWATWRKQYKPKPNAD